MDNRLCASLMDEHRVIEKVLDALECEAGRVEDGAPVDGAFFEHAITFVREFADGLHHQKEERVLFPSLTEAGLPQEGGPVGVMLIEHDEGRRFVATMHESLAGAVAGEAAARTQLSAAARGYVVLLRAHIQKEDTVLFPMAENVLDESAHSRVRTGFEEAEGDQPERDATHRDWAGRLSST